MERREGPRCSPESSTSPRPPSWCKARRDALAYGRLTGPPAPPGAIVELVDDLMAVGGTGDVIWAPAGPPPREVAGGDDRLLTPCVQGTEVARTPGGGTAGWLTRHQVDRPCDVPLADRPMWRVGAAAACATCGRGAPLGTVVPGCRAGVVRMWLLR